jgi:hypothetical protein
MTPTPSTHRRALGDVVQAQPDPHRRDLGPRYR